MTNLQKYNSIFEDCFEVSLVNMNYKIEYRSIGAWDSLGHMNLISAIEEAFDIMLDVEDIIGFTSYDMGKNILLKYDIDIK